MEKKKESPLTIRFKDFHQDEKGITYFKIRVHDRDTTNKWEFQERYSQMREIHKQLSQQYKGDLPDFPSRKWFGNTDKNFLSQRSASLQTYFTNILNHLEIYKYPILMNFFYRSGAQPATDSFSKHLTLSQNVGVSKLLQSENENTKKENIKPLRQKENKERQDQLTEQEKQIKRNEVFTETMERMNEKIQNRFITNLTDFSGQINDQQIHEQKRMQVNQIRFNLKSILLTNLTLPPKDENKSDLNLNENMNNTKISQEMDLLSSKLEACFKQYQNSYSQYSQGIYADQRHIVI